MKREKRDLELKQERAKKKLKQTEELIKQKEKETLEKDRELEKLKQQMTEQVIGVKSEDMRRNNNKRKLANKSLSSSKRTCPETEKSEFEEIFDNELQCTICHELFVSPVNLNCSHAFCFVCIRKWEDSEHKDCPICREPIKSQTRLLVLDNLIDRAIAKMQPEQKSYRQKLIAERRTEEEKLKKPSKNTTRRPFRGSPLLLHIPSHSPYLHSIEINTESSVNFV